MPILRIHFAICHVSAMCMECHGVPVSLHRHAGRTAALLVECYSASRPRGAKSATFSSLPHEEAPLAGTGTARAQQKALRAKRPMQGPILSVHTLALNN